ncbi:uncharacterized protein [Rutidosis leptorrhynchoides]|uniref:uncharacterized protein n=1 Tax=Rutidosis leptorrhynchoides TaxID=125765 RepID=UPI003A99B0E3
MANIVEELRSAMEEHVNQMADLVQGLSSELKTGFKPAIDNFLGFFHAIDWKEPWLISLVVFHVIVLITAIVSRKNTNFQMFLFLFALLGVYFAETLNKVLGNNWKNFSTQNYFDPHGVFLSVLWSGPLLIISIVILLNTMFSLCYLIVRWKRAELRHRARLSQKKDE